MKPFIVFSHLTHSATSKLETFLLCLYLTLISSVLSPLNKAICTLIRASLDTVIGSPLIEPEMSYWKECATYSAIYSCFELYSPSAEMKGSIMFGYICLSGLSLLQNLELFFLSFVRIQLFRSYSVPSYQNCSSFFFSIQCQY